MSENKSARSRRLAAILFADMVGYSRLMQEDEDEALRLRDEFQAIASESVSRHQGEIIKTVGDGAFVAFSSAVEAVRGALQLQSALSERNEGEGDARPIEARVGIHLGDVVQEGEDLFGSGVNVASRIEPLALPGGICISGDIYQQVKNQKRLSFQDVGERALHNIEEPVRIYAVNLEEPEAEATPATKQSIAVLPFQNMSPDPDNEYFADGMTEEITGKLAKIRDLPVAARTSVARFKDAQMDVREIARELGVSSVLEGSVRKAGERVRISAQLIDAASGFHLWAEDFQVELKDVFAVQEEVALKIAEALKLQLAPEEKKAVLRRYTDNPKAYDAYLRGRALVEHFDVREKLEAARGHFQRALALDEEFAPALAGMSLAEAVYARNIGESAEILVQAEDLAGRALAIDPELAVAHLAIGLVRGVRYDYEGAGRQFREALRLDPDEHLGWSFLAWALTYTTPPDASGAEEAARAAVRLQPSHHGAYYQLGRALLLQDRFDEAISSFEHALALNPSFRSPYLGVAQVRLAQGDFEGALEEFGKLEGMALTPIPLVQLGSVYAMQGRRDEALAELERAIAAGYRDLPYLQSSSYLDSVRADPRFAELVESIDSPGDS